MVDSIVSALMVTHRNENDANDLSEYLAGHSCDLVIAKDWGESIQLAQNRKFNVIILDTKVEGMDITNAIHIFRNIDPQVKIIVKTDSSSKQLESQIRQEKIFYYHIDSFDNNDLKLAVQSAIQLSS